MRKHRKPFRYTPRHPEKYVGDASNIVMRSTWEKKFALWCDMNPAVISWNSEGLPIPYFSTADNRVRRYYIDFFVKLRKNDGSIAKLAIEVKPKSQTVEPRPPKRKTAKSESRYIAECVTYQTNMDKWDAAREWCRENGFHFLVMTEDELGIK